MEQTDPTAAFFSALEGRGHEPLLSRASGALRFELADGDQIKRWNVQLDGGKVSVSRKAGPAACTVRADKALFDRIVTGDANAMASFLRGGVNVTGDSELLVLFQRLFRGPQQSDAGAGVVRDESLR